MTSVTQASPFSSTVHTFWQTTFLAGDRIYGDEALIITVNPALEANRRIMLMQTAAGQYQVVITPPLADRLGLFAQPSLDVASLRQKLATAKIMLHGADHVFHYTEAAMHELLRAPGHAHVRQLSVADTATFAAFQSSASEQDLDDAYVELDHWAVFGAFEQDRLVCAASMYPWADEKVADLGVLTLPAYRGMGYARQVVQAICRHAHMEGYAPQYRCQTDNQASIRLAQSAGLSLFGTWEVVSPDSP